MIRNNRGSARRTCLVAFAGRIERPVMEAAIRKLPGNLAPLADNYGPNPSVIRGKRRAVQ